MLPQSFETPRKVNDLGTGVVAGALLIGHGLAGLLAARPPRLTLQSIDGTKASVIDLSVEAVKEIALLSKDAAVVLAESGVLWGLIDLHGSVKLRPIARDVRALCARPVGESAFAIGEDGKGMALTLSRHEIGMRSFSVRGTLHACDIGDQVTYAVVDTAAGRQLHVHPGGTPELGTSVRATLPEGAAGLDRVRGSQSLSAVFKRNEERVCVITGSSKLEAKMIRLDTKPADVAVLDGWLVVATLDGRLSLYDHAALEGAGDEPLAATSAVSLHAHGRPRVLLAGTHKGAASLWVGTTAGEVICAGGVLAPGEVERPIPSAPPRPSAAELAAQLAARDREIEALRAEAEQSKTAHEAAVSALRAEAEQLKSAHGSELEGRDAEKTRVLGEQEASHRRALEERDAAHSKALEEREGAHRQTLDEKETTHSKALEERDAAHGKALEERESAHRQTLDEKETTHSKALAERDAAHGKALEERESAHGKAVSEAQDQRKSAEARVAALSEELELRNGELTELKAKLAATEEQLGVTDEQLSARTSELLLRTKERDGFKAELDAARSTLVAAEEQLRSLAADVEGRTKAYEDLRSEVDRLMGDLTKERDRIEKVFPFGTDGLKSVERARDKLEGVLAQIQGIVFKRPGD